MGIIKDILAKWQAVRRDEWDMEKIESKSKIKYTRRIQDDEKDILREHYGVNKEDLDDVLIIVYDEIDETNHTVYVEFDNSDSEDRLHEEDFQNRRDAKNRLGELLDEYSDVKERKGKLE